MTSIDQQTVRRIYKTGITGLNQEKFCEGYFLYNPISGEDKKIYLLNSTGETVKTWDLSYQPFYGYLLPNGNLFYMGKVYDETVDIFPRWKSFKCGVLQEVNSHGEVVWEHFAKYQHHDARRTASGGAIYSTLERLPDNISAQIKGGVAGTDKHGMWADVLIEVNSVGETIWEWRAIEHLDYKNEVIEFNMLREEWMHINSVFPINNDKVLISARSLSWIGIIDKNTKKLIWRSLPNQVNECHDASLLENGNILVFDNGTTRKDSRFPYSRIVEINPETNEIVWSYEDSPKYNFFSPYLSGTSRLENGNTLITEGSTGRIFQVTPEGEVVWEYISPLFKPHHTGFDSNAVYKATYYLPEQVAHLLSS